MNESWSASAGLAAPPAPMSPSDLAGVVLLVGIQAVLFTSVIVAFMLSLR